MPEQIRTFLSVYLAKKKVWAMHSKKIPTLESAFVYWRLKLVKINNRISDFNATLENFGLIVSCSKHETIDLNKLKGS